MNSFNGFANSIRNIGYYVVNYIYNFPLIDSSLVLYYPLDSSNGNARTANYASGLPVYDASMMGSAMNNYNQNSFVTGLGDLSLNNTMGSTAVAYVRTDTSFNLVPSTGLSISCWFSCSGQVDTSGTLISLYQNSSYPSIELDIVGSRIFSGYYIPPLPVTFSVTGGGAKSGTNSPNNNVNYVFTSNGTFTVIVPNGNPGCSIRVLLVGAGGAGGAGQQGGTGNNYGVNGGGGGGGQVLETPTINITITTTFTVLVGTSNTYGIDGSGTYFYNTAQTIKYDASGGGYGASAYAASHGGGGSTSASMTHSTTSSTNLYNSFVGGTGFDSNIGNGGGGAGAGGSGSNGTSSSVNTIQTNGGLGLTPSNYFVNNISYSEGGPTYVGGINSGTTYNTTYLPTIDNAYIWNNIQYTNIIVRSQFLIDAPNNTGHGGIGGGWFARMGSASKYNSYNIVGGLGGSGICIVSIV
jgi:hypothetical protein